ncbi:MAG: hypothetical protein GWP18_02150 [Proteobacteria bacterium]|nr:hypothetical protein [Pseudomonadota bacterium]
MLPMPSVGELRLRLPRLIVGLVLFGIGIAVMVVADLGLSPWEVLHQGISRRTGIPIGTMGIITGLLVLLLWIPLKERVGLGTVLNVLLIGIVVDLSLLVLPGAVDPLWLRWLMMFSGTLVIAIGSGLYIGVGLGPGPRDGLMTGLARRGIPISVARGSIEISVLLIGWLLGGTVGVGTLVFAFGVGPLVSVFLPRLTMEPLYDYREPDPGRFEGAL